MSFWGNFSFFGGLAKCTQCFPTLPSSLSHSCALGLWAALLSPVPGVSLCAPWAQDLSRAPGIQMESSEHLRAFSSAEKMLGALPLAHHAVLTFLFSLPLVSSDVLLASQTGGETRIHPERWDARVPGASSSGPALLLPCVGSVPRCSRCLGAAALSAKRVISSRSDVRFVKQSHSL